MRTRTRLSLILAGVVAVPWLLFTSSASGADFSNPVLHWKFDDAAGSGTAVDSSGNGYTGTINGNPVFEPGGGAAPLSGGAMVFDGTGDYVSAPAPGASRLL